MLYYPKTSGLGAMAVELQYLDWAIPRTTPLGPRPDLATRQQRRAYRDQLIDECVEAVHSQAMGPWVAVLGQNTTSSLLFLIASCYY